MYKYKFVYFNIENKMLTKMLSLDCILLETERDCLQKGE